MSAGRSGTPVHEFGSARLVAACRLKFCALIGQVRMKFLPESCACRLGGAAETSTRFAKLDGAMANTPLKPLVTVRSGQATRVPPDLMARLPFSCAASVTTLVR